MSAKYKYLVTSEDLRRNLSPTVDALTEALNKIAEKGGRIVSVVKISDMQFTVISEFKQH